MQTLGPFFKVEKVFKHIHTLSIYLCQGLRKIVTCHQKMIVEQHKIFAKMTSAKVQLLKNSGKYEITSIKNRILSLWNFNCHHFCAHICPLVPPSLVSTYYLPPSRAHGMVIHYDLLGNGTCTPRFRCRPKLSYDQTIQTEMTSNQTFQTEVTSDQTEPRLLSRLYCIRGVNYVLGGGGTYEKDSLFL